MNGPLNRLKRVQFFSPGEVVANRSILLAVREKGRWMSCFLPHKLARGQGGRGCSTKDAQEVGLRVNLIWVDG